MKKSKLVISFVIILIINIFVCQFNSYALVNLNEKIDIVDLNTANLENIEKQEIKLEELPIKEYTEENNNTTMSFFSSRATTVAEQLGQKYSNYEPIFIENDKENIYYLTYYSTTDYTFFEIVKQNLETKEKEVVFGKGKYDGVYNNQSYYPIAHYELGNIIFVETYIKDTTKTEYDKVQVFGFDITTNTLVVEQEFNVAINTQTAYPSFAVDEEKRFYFVNNLAQILVYDKSGSLIYSSKTESNTEQQIQLVINSVSPKGKALFYSILIYEENYCYIGYQGIQKLDSGKFVNKDMYTAIESNGKNYSWHFIDDNDEYAINQYGEIVKFNYEADNIAGMSFEILQTANKSQSDIYYAYPKKYPTYATIGNYIYIIGLENKIYKFDKSKNFEYIGKIEGILDTDEDNLIIECINEIDNKINIFYSINNIIYLKTINIEEQTVTEKKNITYNTHISQTYTKEQIKEKFNKSNLFDYSNTIYESEPSLVAPYYEGKLKQGVIDDALNRLNFYRWLYGIDEVSLNSDKLQRNQKGALIQTVNNVLTHFPTQPEGMSDEFYKEAYDGCNIRYDDINDTYSGNCAYNMLPLNVHIDNYVDDINNISDNGSTTDAVGHRWSMLDPNAYAASLGYCQPYSTVSIYYNVEKELTEDFYAFPPAGNFPNELFMTNERWSLYFPETVVFKEGSKLEFIYNGTSYEADIRLEVSNPAITFLMPDELVKILGGSGKTMPEGKITVKLSGVTNGELDDITYQYDVNFFKIEENEEADLLKGDVNYDGKITLYDALQILKQAILGGDLTADELYIMDYNDDDSVSLYDALKFLQQAILG